MYIVEMNVCKTYPFFCFSLLLMNKMNVTLKRVSVLQWKLGKRERVLEDDVFIENTCLGIGSKKRWPKFTRTWFYAGHVVLLANGFPRLNMCASAIFVVGTSDIPPKLNYRSVKSYILSAIIICV